MEGLKLRVLVLDDEEEMTRSLSRLLSLSGYEPVTGGSVAEGMELLDRQFFDVVVSDLFFPDGDGFEIMSHVREHCPKTGMIAMTGNASMDSAIRALRLGADDYIVKPFDFELLCHAIDRLLEHQRMRDEILLSRDRYHALVEELNDGYFVLKNGIFAYANRSMGLLLGQDPASLVGRNILDFCAHGSRSRLKRHLRAIQEKGGAVLDELTLKGADGKDRFVEMKLTLSSCNHKGIVGTCRDVTERKVLWDQLVKAEKLAILGEMIAGIAHELNNKLTPVLGYADMISTLELAEDKRRWVAHLQSAAIGAKSIVESLLLFSRKEQKSEFVPSDINVIVTNAVEFVSASLGCEGVELEVRLHSGLPAVLADPFKIEQVVANILKNAYEVLNGHGKITVETSHDGEDVFISIRDTGPGIPTGLRDRIFEPFFTTKPRGKGTGLGLSVCHGIVREIQGDIDVCSPDKGSGSVFIIRLPASGPNESSAKGLPAAPLSCDTDTERGATAHILIVEDEDEIADLISEFLSSNYEIRVAHNGIQALEVLKEEEFDLIISDIRMSELDGISLYRTLERQAPRYCQRILFMTGMTFDLKVKRFFQETGVPYIKKPFKLDQIAESVGRILGSPGAEKDDGSHSESRDEDASLLNRSI